MDFDINGRKDRHGRFIDGFYKPEITREVLNNIGRLQYLKVNERALTVELKYKGEKMFELFRNFFYGKAFYGDFYVGGDIPFEKIYVGSNLGKGVFERQVNLYKKTEEEIEEKYEESYEAFLDKVRKINEKAKEGIKNNLKSLNPIGVFRDFTVFINSKRILKEGG